MGKQVVVIDYDPRSDLMDIAQGLGIPVIRDDAIKETVLTAASIERAQAILLCTQNDSLNLQVALKARNYNPEIKVILRIFDNDFAKSLKQQFGFEALSATAIASPIFAASATDVDITPPIMIEGQPNSLARLQVPGNSDLVGMSIEKVEDLFNVSVVLLKHTDDIEFHPSSDSQIRQGDTIAVLGTPENIDHLVMCNSC
jgi:Trk K+ transport system NAD-binding subunit